MRKYVLKFGILLLSIAFGFLLSVNAFAQNIIKFGAAISLTGVLAREGKLTQNGLEFWKDTVNEKGGIDIGGVKYKVDIKYYDDQSDTNTSGKLTEKLISEDGIKFLFAPYGSGGTFTSSAIAEKYRLPIVASMSTAPKVYSRGYKYLFGHVPLTDVVYNPLFELLAKQQPKPKTVAILYQNSLFPVALAESAELGAKKYGFEVVYNEKFPKEVTDLSAPLTQIKAKNPDVFVGAGYLKDILLMRKQSKELNFSPKVYSLAVGVTYPEFVQSLGKDAEYVVAPDWWTKGLPWKDKVFGTVQDFYTNWKNKYGYEPDHLSAGSAAAGEVFQFAMEKAKSIDPQKVRDAMLELEIETVLGPIKFTKDGQFNIAAKTPIVQVQKGKLVEVAPAEVAHEKMLYPQPEWGKW